MTMSQDKSRPRARDSRRARRLAVACLYIGLTAMMSSVIFSAGGRHEAQSLLLAFEIACLAGLPFLYGVIQLTRNKRLFVLGLIGNMHEALARWQSGSIFS